MRQLFLALIFGLLTTTPMVAQGEASGAIQSVIQQQVDAFQRDDFATAFSFASPGIRRFFQTSDNFGLMVRQGFPMVWRPDELRFLGLRQQDGRQFQKVMIRDRDGVLHVLEYQMIPDGDGWQINGVDLLEQPEVGA